MDRINPDHVIPVSLSKFLLCKKPSDGGYNGPHRERSQQNPHDPPLVELKQPCYRQQVGDSAESRKPPALPSTSNQPMSQARE